ncbi:hypothetical protein GCM10011529_12590 [Polymorphobacter glacialis]|uniref:PIN domain-containing protein n=1 Tax=Sandarakinorhabdus glacialis TaxID=1614636 RepID=A0A916ZPG0_9SPHN|nr:type II toxin-antitoxin system VapC family toxin [Polymorphobacter glacialis]GGE07677.1 hypothetical protein GCM10011529_12590 [Polymorphobacter glacialis]
MTDFNVVDSSGWLEYFGTGSGGDRFASAIENSAKLIVPTISIYEVYKRLSAQRSEHLSLQAVSVMRLATVVELDIDLSLAAARLSKAHKLPMADSIIYAIARRFDAMLYTQDADFDGLPGVRYFAKT